MKIIFIRQKANPYGGAERYLSRLTAHLQKEGISVKILHAHFPQKLPSWLKAILFNHQICHTKKEPNAIYFSLDRVTCPDIYRAGDGVHRAFLQTKPFSFNPLHLIYPRLEQAAFRNAKAIIANSKMVKDQILEFYPDIESQKIHVIYNGVPIPESIDKKKAKLSLSKEFNADPSIPWILFTGSGFARKGVKEFISLLSELPFPFHAFVVGKDKKLSHYMAYAEALRLSPHITFTGPRKDATLFFEAADLFLFPTRYEPFSNVVLEALAYGTPPITTKQNGAHEILPQAWVMEQPDDDQILQTVSKLLENRKTHQKAVEQAREIAQTYSIDRNAKQTIELIKKVSFQK